MIKVDLKIVSLYTGQTLAEHIELSLEEAEQIIGKYANVENVIEDDDYLDLKQTQRDALSPSIQ